MAIVKRLKPRSLKKSKQHTEVDCTYSIIEDDGVTYLQLDTYGSSTREYEGKKSQSLRLTPEAQASLFEILIKELGLK